MKSVPLALNIITFLVLCGRWLLIFWKVLVRSRRLPRSNSFNHAVRLYACFTAGSVRLRGDTLEMFEVVDYYARLCGACVTIVRFFFILLQTSDPLTLVEFLAYFFMFTSWCAAIVMPQQSAVIVAGSDLQDDRRQDIQNDMSVVVRLAGSIWLLVLLPFFMLIVQCVTGSAWAEIEDPSWLDKFIGIAGDQFLSMFDINMAILTMMAGPLYLTEQSVYCDAPRLFRNARDAMSKEVGTAVQRYETACSVFSHFAHTVGYTWQRRRRILEGSQTGPALEEQDAQNFEDACSGTARFVMIGMVLSISILSLLAAISLQFAFSTRNNPSYVRFCTIWIPTIVSSLFEFIGLSLSFACFHLHARDLQRWTTSRCNNEVSSIICENMRQTAIVDDASPNSSSTQDHVLSPHSRMLLEQTHQYLKLLFDEPFRVFGLRVTYKTVIPNVVTWIALAVTTLGVIDFQISSTVAISVVIWLMVGLLCCANAFFAYQNVPLRYLPAFRKL
eukprot:ANDGO_07657.mRNA.1 hypothetical protein